jgi:hypothetical protein
VNIKEVLEDIKRHIDYVNATNQTSIRDNQIKVMYFEIERLNNIIKTKDEGIKAFVEDLCEESIEKEKIKVINKQLWEENTRLSNGRELDQNAIDTLQYRIDKAIEYILNNKLYCFKYDDEELFEITTDKKAKDDLLNILRGDDKE